jgi:hypothetical protein
MNNLPEKYKSMINRIQMRAYKDQNYALLDVTNRLVYVPQMGGPAATDGKRIFISDSLFERPENEIYFIINHEYDHIIYRHLDRFRSTNQIDSRINNIATDIIINEILQNSLGIKMPDDALSRDNVGKDVGITIRGRNSNEIIKEIEDIIRKRAEERKQELKDALEEALKEKGKPGNQSPGNQGKPGNQSSENQGEPSPGRSDGDESGEEKQNQSGQSGQSGLISDEELLQEALNELLGEKADEYFDKLDQEKEDQEKIKSIKDNETKEEADARIEDENAIQDKLVDIENEISSNRRRAAEANRNKRVVKVDWKTLLNQFLGKHLVKRRGRNWRRPSKRYSHVLPSNVFLPDSKVTDYKPRINLYLDISGSMHHIIADVRGALLEAEHYFKKYKTNYHEFDTKIYPLDKEVFHTNLGAEGGGTDIKKVIEHYRTDNSADLGIIVTDAEDAFSESLSIISKPLMMITNNQGVTTDNDNVQVVITNFTDE